MHTILWTIFIISLTLILYNYFLYPALVYIFSKIKPINHKQYEKESEYPSICLVIPAISDAKELKKKIQNTLKLYYPKGKLLILAISDKNNEPAQELLREYKKHGIITFSKRGMAPGYQALNIGAKLAKTTLIVFSDTNNEFNDLALMKLARHFKDPRIAAVSGVRVTLGGKSRQTSTGDNLYWKYETMIKVAESKLGSTTAAAGEIMAIRRELYTPVDLNYINFDAAITFKLIKKGYRVIVDEEAISLTHALTDMKSAFSERTTRAKGSFQTLFSEFGYLFPPRNWFAFTFVSHKCIRWFVPFLLLTMFIVPFFMLEDMAMLTLTILQLGFYLFGLAGWLLRNQMTLPGYMNLITYFTIMNMAMFAGFFRYLIRR